MTPARRHPRIRSAYNPALFTRATAEQLVAGFLAVAEQFAADPGITLDRLRIQSPEQHRLALEQSLRTGDSAPDAEAPETVVDAFRATVARTPDTSALVDAAGTDSRRQLRPAPRPGPGPRQGTAGLRSGARRPGGRGPAAHGRRRRCRTGGAGRGRGLHPGGPLLPGGADPDHPRGRRSRRRDLRRTGRRRPRPRGSADPGRRHAAGSRCRHFRRRPGSSAARPPETWPTCSTPPVPPDAPRGWPSRTAPSPTCTATTTAPCTRRASRPPVRTAPSPWRTSPASASTPPGTRCCG